MLYRRCELEIKSMLLAVDMIHVSRKTNYLISRTAQEEFEILGTNFSI